MIEIEWARKEGVKFDIWEKHGREMKMCVVIWEKNWLCISYEIRYLREILDMLPLNIATWLTLWEYLKIYGLLGKREPKSSLQIIQPHKKCLLCVWKQTLISEDGFHVNS